MRVLAHIHTFNDADIIDGTIAGVLRQTRPVDGILIVDNASTDGTLQCPSIAHATVLRHPENRGTSGAVHSGIGFALENGYDWIWVFDADTVPEPDALAKLLELYAGWPQSRQDETGFLACLPINASDGKPVHGQVFTRRGISVVSLPPDERHYLCHVTIWSGCLYRLQAVRGIGLPNRDYVLDGGEGEYGYHVMMAGYKGFIHQDSIVRHNIRGTPSFEPVELKFGRRTITFYEVPPIRCYYMCRNALYFALYDAALGRFWLLVGSVMGIVRLTGIFMLRPRSHESQIIACFRGIWHGITGNVVARY